jgi:CRP/FNR family transcriptional regulator, cyclic AMP receptor protein
MEDSFSKVHHILREIPFFEDFTDDELEFFSKNTSLRHVPEQTTLFKQGDVGNYLFFVVEGSAEIHIKSAEGKPVIIATFRHGSCIGEMSIVDDYARSATIIVTESSELLILTKNRFESICQKNPDVAIKFLLGLAKNLSIRLRKTTGRFADLS